jgi:sugar lactone lactonase YvrE
VVGLASRSNEHEVIPMASASSSATLVSLVSAILCLPPLAGCGDDGEGGTDASPGTTLDGGATADTAAPAPCTATGMGTLAIAVEGLPAEVAPMVMVTGPAGAVPFAPSTPVNAGSYAVAATRVTAPDPLVRRAFAPVVMTSPACVMNGMTATVRVVYTEIATSNKVWLGNANAPAQLLGYASSAVRATGMPPASVAAMVKGSANIAFDKDGNLWAGGNTVADPPILRIPAAMLGAGGSKTADVMINSPEFGGGSPRSTSLAFDREGNLWSTVGWKHEVVRFAAAQLTASGSPMPGVAITGLKGPRGLAFDKSGNLWLANADENQVLRFDAARLTASTAAAADLVIVAMSPPPVIGPRTAPSSLAFDLTGNLWVSYSGGMVMLPAAELTGTGMKTLTPAIQIGVSVTALPEGVAFDEGGGLWFAGSRGNFVRLAPDQLTSGGDKTPSTVITSPDVMSAGDFAIFPAPAGLPLYHTWP